MTKIRAFYNQKLVKALSLYLEHYPDIRFGQALWNLGFIKRENGQIVDNFYEESETTFNNVKKIVDNLKDE